MKKIAIKGAEAKHESDKGKRIYRAALECIRRLDELVSGNKAYRDAFLPETIVLRNRLKDYCERLMFLEPVEYGRRAEELLWRKVFYDIIQLAKPNRKQLHNNSGLECAVRTHLSAAAGYYHHLLARLQHEYELALDGFVDLFYMPELKAAKKPHQLKKKEFDVSVLEWANKACHRCLICLGDIARYQAEFDGLRSRSSARRYYYQAINMKPSIGMPYNQLGTLVGSVHYNCSSAYYYMRCLMCEVQFEGAQGNLKRLLDKNRKRYSEITQPTPRDLSPDLQRYKDIKHFLVRFLYLLDAFHYNVQNVASRDLQECCQTTLHDFSLCMYYQPLHCHQRQIHELMSTDEKLPYLDDDVVFKVLVMSVIAMYNLHNVGSKSLSAAIAFSLALFSHILNHVITRIQSAIYDYKHVSRDVTSSDMIRSDVSDISTENEVTRTRDRTSLNCYNREDKQLANQREEKVTNHEDSDGKITKKKQMLKKLEKRRRRHNNNSMGDSDSSIGSDFDDLDLAHQPSQMSDSDDDLVNYLSDTASDTGSDGDDLMESQQLKSGLADDNDVFSDQQTSSKDSSLNPFGMAAYNNGSVVEVGADDVMSLCDEVVLGRRHVTLPPGFDHDIEAAYVDEITQKLATFTIETDTETGSILPTDNDNNSVLTTESDLDGDAESEDGEERMEDSFETSRVLVDILNNEGLLSSIKIFCDWMMGHMNIIETCAHSSHTLWSRLSVLLNLLPSPDKICNINICESKQLADILETCGSADWLQTQPITEDLHLRSLPALSHVHRTIDFNHATRLTLNSTQETLLRVGSLLRFGHVMAENGAIPLQYSQNTSMFFGPLANTDTGKDEKQAQEKMVDNETRRNQLMRDMAQLRLQAEVIELEGSLKQARPVLPSYVVVETTALSENLPEIKRMLTSQRFIIIVPLAVIDELDVMKKESRRARDAIRWLELKFKRGNRYIRAQKLNEKGAQTPPKALKRNDKEKWSCLRILDCCRYFSRQQSACNSHEKVSLLTHESDGKIHQIIKSQQHIDGISVESVGDFVKKLFAPQQSSGLRIPSGPESHPEPGAVGSRPASEPAMDNG